MTDPTGDASAPHRPTARLKVGVPAVVAVVAVGAVPFVIGGSDGDTDAIRTGSIPSTSPTTTAEPVDDESVFTSAGSLEEASDRESVAVPSPSATVIPGSTTTLVPITVDTLPTEPEAILTEPVDPPADPRGFEEEVLLGGIEIPKLGVDEPLLQGITLTTLDKAPGHWPGTALPGQVGNVVVAAHRTSHGGPFRDIDQLVEGDTVVFGTDGGDVEYRVTETMIVNPDAIWIVDQTDTATATLFACHPPGSVAQRIVVKLELA